MKPNIVIKVSLVALFASASLLMAKGENHKSETTLYTTYQSGGSDWVAPKYVEKLKNPLAGNAKATKDGKILFNTNCVTCHGDKGEGNGPSAATLNPKPKNLTLKQVQEQPDGALYWKITTGKPPMLSWQQTLNEKQRWSLVNYIRELRKK
ncbi:MAG: c-type cytochrome [Bacteroidota bacterium]